MRNFKQCRSQFFGGSEGQVEPGFIQLQAFDVVVFDRSAKVKVQAAPGPLDFFFYAAQILQRGNNAFGPKEAKEVLAVCQP
jgi:hypothetical protein